MDETKTERSTDSRKSLDKPILRCEKLRRTFQSGDTELHVLRGVDFELFEGEIAGISGSSGAGKSTLLHLLGLLDTPSGGEIYYRGRALTGLSEEEAAKIRNREFGFVFQSYHLLPEFTALENVLMPARIGAGTLAWMEKGKALGLEAEALLEGVGLRDRMHHVPTRLSGGERQRVALARAFMNKPSIVFCDEPTGNLDTKTSEEIFALIEDYNRVHNLTFLIVSHDKVVTEHTQRCLEMKDGVLL